MAKLITKVEVLHNNRSNKFAKIMFEMLPPIKQGDNFVITIKDNIVYENEGGLSFQFKESKTVTIPTTKINELYAYVESMIPADTPYSEKTVLAEQMAFLIFMQTDIIESTGKCIYGLDGKDFEIYEG